MSETQLLNLLNHYLVLEFQNNGLEGMCVNEFLPLCAALVYPHRNEKIELTKDIITPIITSVRKFTRRIDLAQYSLQGLRSYFKVNWLPKLSFKEQKQLLSCVSLIVKIEDSGYFSIKDNERVHNAYLNLQNLPNIASNYGEEPNEAPEDNHLNEPNVETMQAADRIELSCNEPNTEESYDSSNLEMKTVFAELRNFCHAEFPNGIMPFRYFWQYKISTNQYEKLKEILKNMDLENNLRLLKKQFSDSSYGTLAFWIAICVSEWYKRESSSLDGDQCLKELGLSGKSNNVWRDAGIPIEFLHQDAEESRRRQIAMCVLGGLPLCCVNHSPRFKDFVNKLSNLNGVVAVTDDDINEIVSSFDDNNRVFKRSLETGSCNEYLLALANYLHSNDDADLPFCQSDLSQAPFVEFKQKLQEGYGDVIRENFFQPELRIWTDDDTYEIETEFYIRIGLKNAKNIITERELNKFGIAIPKEISYFKVKMKITTEDGNSYISNSTRLYHRIGNGCNDFNGAFGSELSTEIDLFSTKRVDLICEYAQEESLLYKYETPSAIKLYPSEEAYLWRDKTQNASQRVLLYDSSKYCLVTSNSEITPITKADEAHTWNWILQTETIVLRDIASGEDILFELGLTDRIAVTFRTKELRKNIVLTETGNVRGIIGEESIELPIVYYYRQGRTNSRTLALTCDGTSGAELFQKYSIEYKQIGEYRYIKWDANNSPEQGFLKLRIKSLDPDSCQKEWVGEVYFIPQEMPIKRNLENNYIYINCTNVIPAKDILVDNFDREQKRYRDFCDSDVEQNTILFRVGDDKSYLLLEVYRAFQMAKIYNRGRLIKAIAMNVKPPVANILRNDITIERIDENGAHQDSVKEGDYIDYFADPHVLATNMIDNDIFRQYVYIENYNDGGKERNIHIDCNVMQLNISNKYESEYRFYYWSGHIEEKPILMTVETDSMCFTLPKQLEEKAVVFQSLHDMHPNFYFRPFYGNENWQWVYYLNRYRGASQEYLVKCFQMAIEHKIYFCVFPALHILQNRTRFTIFIREYIKSKNYNLSNSDVRELTRLSKELVMDWFFVQRAGEGSIFRGIEDESKKKFVESMKKLLLQSPITQGRRGSTNRFVDYFLSRQERFNIHNGGLPRQFLKALDDYTYDRQTMSDVNIRMSLLNKLIHTDENIFEEINCILNI